MGEGGRGERRVGWGAEGREVLGEWEGLADEGDNRAEGKEREVENRGKDTEGRMEGLMPVDSLTHWVWEDALPI